MAIEIFLYSKEMPGIHQVEDESEYKPNDKRFIKLESVHHGLSRPLGDIRPSAFDGSFRMGQLEHGCMTVVKKFDTSSMSILKAHLETTPLPIVHVFGSRVVVLPDGSRCRRAVLHIKLASVVIADYEFSVTGETAEETLQLRYTSIGWGVRPVKRGTEKVVSSWAWAWWDGKKNMAGLDQVQFPELNATDDVDKAFADAGFD